MKLKLTLFLCGLLLSATPIFADDAGKDTTGLKDAVILIIRHAEKPESGTGLTPTGQERARAYVNYFKNFTLDSQPLTLDHLFAAADSTGSSRPRLTLEPLSKAVNLAIDVRFKNKNFDNLADDLRSQPHGKHILICWHHGEIPELLQALGADPRQLLPKGKWPDEVFGWLIQLRYDSTGHLTESRCINENLLPDDAANLVPKAP